MNKKIVTIIIASVLALALVVTGVILLLKNSFASPDDSSKLPLDEGIIRTGSVTASVGDKIKVPVSFEKNPGTMSMCLYSKFDAESLKYLGYQKGDFLTDYQFEVKDNVITFLNLEDKDIAKDGVLYYLEFEVLEGAKTSEILTGAGQFDMCNYDEELITVTPIAGTITIK